MIRRDGSPQSKPLRNIALRRARAKTMIAMRIQNWSADQIAAHFDLTRKTIDETMDWAKKEGIIEEFEDQLIRDLVPLAMGAYKKALSGDEPNIQAARDVLQGAGILKKPSDRAVKSEPMDEVQIWMMKRQRRTELSGTNGESSGSGRDSAAIPPQITAGDDVLDADVLPASPGADNLALNGEDYLSQCDEFTDEDEAS